MRQQKIADIFCVSCVLLIFSVNALTNCPSGWFGTRCNYKCRCVNDKCDQNGQCTDSYTCQGGWFGPECQYVDLAYSGKGSSDLTDGDDKTCAAAPAVDQASVILEEPTFFTWLRIRTTDTASAMLRQLVITFASNTTDINCADMRKHFVDNTTLDVHCTLLQYIDQVTVNGEAAGYLCSVYICGGRNVALKERAEQDTTYSNVVYNRTVNFSADLAVDGNTNPGFWDELTCTHTNGTPSWTLVLSRERIVNRYVIYNRNDSEPEQLSGFTLQSYHSKDSSTFSYRDHHPDVQMKYTVIHVPTVVEIVDVIAHNAYSILTLCEVEVYGDSICDAGHYGRECELTCACAAGDACFVATGACPSGCPVGLEGEGCREQCQLGRFGAHCNSSCSPNCLASANVSVSACDHVTGVCLHGCRSDFSGATCQVMSSLAVSEGRGVTELILALCVLVGVTFFAGFCFSARRRSPSKEESVAGPLHPKFVATLE